VSFQALPRGIWIEPSARDPGRFDIIVGLLYIDDDAPKVVDLRFIVDGTGELHSERDRA